MSLFVLFFLFSKYVHVMYITVLLTVFLYTEECSVYISSLHIKDLILSLHV